ncbi:MAG: hypothetical protein HY602_01750 [Parcubacteria group bacterium]|nr:hypothetical protein [Parcubacteria group bacterium]
MRRLTFIIAGVLLLLIGTLSYIFIIGRKGNNQERIVSDVIDGGADQTAPVIQGLPVEKLPDFAAQDCRDRAGIIKTFTEQGITREKCVVEGLSPNIP